MSKLKLIFWDVQHGSACYVCTPNNKHIVVDLGTGQYDGTDTAFSPLRHLRAKYGVAKLDAVLVTHPHTDHIDDILNFDLLSPTVFYRPRHIPEADIRSGNRAQDKQKVDKYLEVDQRYREPVPEGTSPVDPNVNGCAISALWTPRTCATSNLNNQSIAWLLAFAGTKVLLTGDQESCAWTELLGDPSFLKAIKGTDILLAPHHGRDSGFCADIYKHFGRDPHLTIISDGRFCDTSATDRYSDHSRGWKVHSRSGGPSETRKCVTTRNDGVIHVECYTGSDGQNYLDVKIK